MVSLVCAPGVIFLPWMFLLGFTHGKLGNPIMRTSLALIVLALAALPAFSGGDAKPADRTAIAKAFVAAQVKGDFAAAMKEFDDVMKKASPADKMEATWKLVEKQVGPFQKQ